MEAVDISGDGGLLKSVITAGHGDESPAAGHTVHVHYVGTLEDGSKFDSSRDRDEKFQFKLGQGQVIKGWDVGVATMKRGEVARLTCRSDYAYGEHGSPPSIPGGATLIFEVELFDWSAEDLSEAKDGGIQREKITEGFGYISPKEGAYVEVHLKGMLPDGTVFDDKDYKFELDDETPTIPPGVHAALKHFKKSEKSRIKLRSQYGFVQCPASFSIPEASDLVYEVLLKTFTNEKEYWELEEPERVTQAELYKTKGTNLFKEARYDQAIRMYTKVVDMLDAWKHESTVKDVSEPLLLSARLNLALCHGKLEDHAAARDQCDAALLLDANNEKALFRRGQAQAALSNHELAHADFLACLRVAPDNKAARKQSALCADKIKAERAKEKSMYANMFAKSFALHDKDDDDSQGNDSALNNIGDWDNKLADGMMTIQQEMEAFGETMPEPQYNIVDSDGEDRGAA